MKLRRGFRARLGPVSADWILIALSLCAGPAHADSERAQRLRTGPAVSIQAYGKQNPACLEWSNGCIVCVADDGVSYCSTPGIACVPAGLTCKRLLRKP